MREVVNDVYQELRNGSMSVEDASKKIIECVFKTPRKFGLLAMEEDEKSEFILYLYSNMERLIQNYSSNLSSFATYLTTVITNVRKSWYREHYHALARNHTVTYYLKNENNYVLNETEEKYSNDISLDLEPMHYSNNEVFTILILALKSSYFLTPRHISILARKTGFSEETLYALKEEIDKKIAKKIQKFSLESEIINSMYIKKNSCMLELMCIDKNSTTAKRIEKKKMFYEKRWKRHIENIRSFSSIKPSNKHIAEVLHIKEALVMRLLKNVKNIDTSIFLSV